MLIRRLLFILISGIHILHAQTVEITGSVRDSVTGAPLSHVTVSIQESRLGTVTDDGGRFHLNFSGGDAVLDIRFLGYESKSISLAAGQVHTGMDIILSPAVYELKDIIIRPGKERYTKKGNPAVDLARKVIEHKNDGRDSASAPYRVEVYDRLSLSFVKPDTNIAGDILFRRLPFLKKYVDISPLTGNPLLTVSIRESLADKYHRPHPSADKVIVKAKRQQGVDTSLDDSGMLSDNLDEILKGADIFSNDVNILLNRFVSPLSSVLAISYYKYYILDTVALHSDTCTRLAFVPFSKEGYGFTGMMYISTDGSYSVRRAELNVPRDINLNWVRHLRIELDYDTEEGNIRRLTREDIQAHFTAMPGNAPDIYARRIRSYSGYQSNPPDIDHILRISGENHSLRDAAAMPADYWTARRHIPLTRAEDDMDSMLAQLKTIPAYNVLINTLSILISNYIPTRPQNQSIFDIGPIYSIYSTNYLEGKRLRIGGMTTANLHSQIFASGYVAFGLADRKIKYRAGLTYSLHPKEYHEKEAPIHNISAYRYFDVNTPGQNFISGNDNILLSQPAGLMITRMQYIHKTEIRYEREWPSRLTLSIRYTHEKNTPAGTLRYTSAVDGHNIPYFTSAGIGLQLRYAPGERPFSGRTGRDAVFNLSKDAPIIHLSHFLGIKDLFGSQYAPQHTEIGLERRLWLSSFGHVDIILRGGHIWNRQPYPLLFIPNTNQSMFIQEETFSLMRPLEFISDTYAALHLTYCMKGWILNHVPVINRLRLREVLTVSGIYGHLSDRNNPEANPRTLFRFPDGTQTFGSTPYMEAGIGIENIFRVMRIDYVRRLTITDSPGIRKSGLRLGFRFSF